MEKRNMFNYSLLLILLITICINDAKLFGRTLDKDTQLRIQGYCNWQCKEDGYEKSDYLNICASDVINMEG
uniref:Secreted protein n=1 Tax=Ascaris lumbricoides TaxID=6252 RepID=A0A0M3I287_ASCLU